MNDNNILIQIDFNNEEDSINSSKISLKSNNSVNKLNLKENKNEIINKYSSKKFSCSIFCGCSYCCLKTQIDKITFKNIEIAYQNLEKAFQIKEFTISKFKLLYKIIFRMIVCI